MPGKFSSAAISKLIPFTPSPAYLLPTQYSWHSSVGSRDDLDQSMITYAAEQKMRGKKEQHQNTQHSFREVKRGPEEVCQQRGS